MSHIQKPRGAAPQEFETNPEVLNHYNLLADLGVFREIDRLKALVLERNELLGEASALFTQTEVADIARTTAGFLLNKFIPRRLSFLFIEEGAEEVRELAFSNMHEMASDTHLIDLEPFERYFSSHLGLVRFSAIRREIDNQVALQDLAPMEPELVIPVKGYGGLYGLVTISAKVVGGDYTVEELAYVDRLMGFAAIAIQNSIHYSSSVTDNKTRLFNNDFIQSEIDEEISRVRRYGGEFSVLMLDLDHFKRLNDEFGHIAGDHVLKEVAGIISASVRDGDVAARFGGEEFMIMLHQAGSCEAFTIAERLRRGIMNRQFVHMGKELRVTVSIGCATFSAGRDLSRDDLVQLADQALYRSKRSGRNTTSVAGSGLLYRATH